MNAPPVHFVPWNSQFAGVVVLVAVCSVSQAADFRVETAVFVGDDSSPISRNLTVFCEQTVYDFSLDKANEATVFNVGAGQFTLLDADRSVQHRVGAKQLLQLADAIRARALQNPVPRIRFAAAPHFTETFDSDSANWNPGGDADSNPRKIWP